MKNKRHIIRTLTVLIICLLCGVVSAHAKKKPWVKIENNVMTFLYGEKETLATDEYWLNEGENNPAWKDKAREIQKAVFDPSFKDARPTTCYSWFRDFSDITSIEGMENLNTSEVTTMGSMFYDCELLPSLDLSNFDTRKVINMKFMFSGCDNLASLDVSSFDTQNVTNMEFMFSANNLQKIFVSDKFTTNKVTDSDKMFHMCLLLSGATGYIISNDLDYEGKAFANAQTGYFTDVKLKDEAKYYWVKYDNGTLTYYYGKKTTLADNESYMKTMFSMYVRPSYADDVKTAVIDKSVSDARPVACYMWFSYENLTEIKGLENLNTSDMIDMRYMFRDCNSLRSLDLSHFDTSKAKYMNTVFLNCYALQELDLSSFNTSNVTTMGNMFDTCLSLPSVDISNFNTSKLVGTGRMFFQCFSLRKIFAGNDFNIDKVTNSKGMFESCFALEGAIEYDEDKTGAEYANTQTGYFTDVNQKADAEYGWTRHDGSTLTYYYGKKPKLEENDRYLTVGYVTPEPWMKDITKVVFDNSFQEAKPVTSSQWFQGYSSLTVIEGWENVSTDKVFDMDDMFNGCEKLESVDLSNFNSTKVDAMNHTFANCPNLKRIYVGSKFSTANVITSKGIFDNCPATIYCPANSYATISASKTLEGRDFMAYTGMNPTAEYGTICVPQGSDLATDTYENFDKLYSVSNINVNGGYVQLKDEKQLEPGKAYIYHSNLPADCFKAVIAYKPNAATAAQPVNEGLLRGTFLETAAPANSYVLNEDALFHLAAADGTTAINANQAYLQPEAGTALPSTLSLKFDTDGIEEITNAEGAYENNTIYDLTGRRVTLPLKGRVYIMNGKKVINY